MAEEEKKDEKEEEKKDNAKGEDTEEEGGEDSEDGGKKSKKKLIIIIAAVVVLLIIIGAGLFFSGILGGSDPETTDSQEQQTEEGAESTEGESEDGTPVISEGIVYYDLEEFVVNLNVGSQTPSFLKLTVSLELQGESQIPSIEIKMPRIRDSFQVYLRELRKEDLQGSAGIYRLREELLLRINKAVYPTKISDILFKEILVQ